MKYVVRYYFGKDFYVSRIMESESKEYAYMEADSGKKIQFEEGGVFYSFRQEDVKYISVAEYKTAGFARGIR